LKEKEMRICLFRISILLFIFSLAASCSEFITIKTESQIAAQEIIIDGKTDDWRGNLKPVKDTNVAVSVSNDQQNLYLCLRVDNEAYSSQIMRQGLTVWFDLRGKKKKTLGLRYPIAFQPERDRPTDWQPGGNQKPPMKMEPGQEPLFEERFSELEIIRPGGNEPVRMNISEVKGTEIKLVPSRLGLIYELKVPISESDEYPFALNLVKSKQIAIGFEVNEFEGVRPQRMGRIPGGPGGMPPMGGGFGPGRRGPGGRSLEAEKLKIWAITKISSVYGQEPSRISSISLSTSN
jgi:hypothetical protein